MIYSNFLINKSKAKKLAYLGIFTALSLVSNFLEIKFFDVQFSLSILVSCFIGIILGPISGFTCCILGDFLGYIINSNGYPYMFWVGLSTGLFAFISGYVFYVANKIDIKKYNILKLVIIFILTFFICTLGINSFGFYIYNKTMGFSNAVLSYINNITQNNIVTYFYYLLYRLIFKGQIFNSIINYILIIITYLFIRKIKLFKCVFN